MAIYGIELIIDLHNCDPSTFNRRSIKKFFAKLCERIEMEPEKLCWWDDHGVPPEERETEPHMKGTSAVQFIRTSNITIHTLELLKRVYLNIFSCKEFDPEIVKQFSKEWFGGEIVNQCCVERT